MAQRCVAACLCRALIVAGVAMFTVAHAQVPDDAREDRWAQEVAPQVVVGEVVWLATKQRAKVLALFTDAHAARGSVVIAHGLGVHPDWGLIGALRTRLADAGIATLSVQMPVLGKDATREQYRALYPIAGDRIAAAIRNLRGRGVANVAIVSHSVGAGMVDAYLAGSDALPVAAWIPVGMLVDFKRLPREPVLDIVAENDFPEVLASATVRAPRLPHDRCSRELSVPATDHYFEGATDSLVKAIVPFLERAFAGKC